MKQPFDMLTGMSWIVRIAVVALLFVPEIALAQARTKRQTSTPRQAATPPAPAARPAPTASAYVLKMRAGIVQAMAGNHEAAVTTLREAVQIEPSSPDAYYYMGEAQRIQGDMAAALQSFQTSLRMATGDDGMRARAMHGIASTLERIDGRSAEARTAWASLSTFADAHRDIANPEIPRARVESLDRITTLAEQYVQVRERIAARERENAARPAAGTAPSTPR